MTLHFAYGSNMNRALMQSHAPEAKPLGIATVQKPTKLPLLIGRQLVIVNA